MLPAVQRADSRADDASLEIAVPTLAGTDLRNGTATQDVAALDLGVQQFLAQLDDLGNEFARSLQQTSAAAWIAAAVVGAVGLEVARRRLRARLAVGISGKTVSPADSWVPGLSGPIGSEQP
jgi:hypothetical protein